MGRNVPESGPNTLNDKELLRVVDLKKHFPIKKGFKGVRAVVRAVDGVSFDVRAGETFGLVGESGCGKSTLGRVILRLIPHTSGHVFFDGAEITAMPSSEVRKLRGLMQIVFQDPYASLNPRMSVGEIISEPLIVHGVRDRTERARRVKSLLDLVGLRETDAERYPHEFSGGQRQRIGIARALALNPRLVICDEPVSALDVSIQSQILNLLEELQDTLGLTYIFISHGLNVVEYLSDRVAVMYLGKIVELGPADKVFRNTQHPYTKALLSAIPIPDPEATRDRIVLEGDVPSPVNPPRGCRFSTRCWKATDECTEAEPTMVERSPGHWVACHLPEA